MNQPTDLSEALIQIALLQQDITTIRTIILKGGSTADIIEFLDTPNAEEL
jgi:hypothetical protein